MNAVLPAAIQDIRHLPVYFEPNHGQVNSAVKFVARTPGHTVFLTGSGAVLSTKGHASIRLQFHGASERGEAEGLDRVPAVSNYFTGNSPSEWRTGVPQFEKVRYAQVYPGIDVIYYGTGLKLEYDMVVAPGADPGLIDIAYEGARPNLTADGDLLIGDVRQHRPNIYQDVKGSRVAIAGSYRLQPDGHVRFSLAKYDRSLPLVIDPIVQFSLYLGTAGYDAGFAVTVDEARNSYITGNTNSISFPSQGTAQEYPGGNGDAFVAKYSPNGDQLIYITYLGGKQNDAGNGIAVDAQHNVYVSGYTLSMDFPLQNGAQKSFGGGEEDAFVTKISPGGDKIVYSTYIGGGANDFGNGIAVDGSGNAYVTGWTRSSDFPTANAFQSGPSGGGEDVFVTKISPAGSAFVYSTFVGGNGRDLGTGIAVDSTGAAYVAGSTSSTVFPAAGAFQARNAGAFDGFVFKLAPAGNTLVFCTYLGGAGDDTIFRIVLDGTGIYVGGYTSSSNFPLMNPAQSTAGGSYDVFVAKLSLSGASLLYSTYLGGSGDDFGYGLAVDSSGSAYIAGWTASTNFPTRNALQPLYGGGASDAFVARLAPNGNSLLYSTFLGGSGDDEAHGIALDPTGVAYVTGRTSSASFPGARNRYTEGSGKFDAFLTRISADVSSAFALVTPSALSFSGATAAPQTILLSSSGAEALNFAAFATSNGNWLSVNPASGGTTPATLTVTVNPAGLGGGTVSGTITINVPGASNSPILVPVSYALISAPVIGSISPSSINAEAGDTTVTINGSGFTSTSSVSVNGVAAGTIFIDASTLRAVIPQSQLTSVGNLRIAVSGASGTSQPLIFNVTGGGISVLSVGVVNAATFQSGSFAPGEIITIFGTGFGPAALAGTTVNGSAVLSNLVGETRVLFDGLAAPLIYAARGQLSTLIPYSAAGRTSISMQVEYQGVASGPVVLTLSAAHPGVFTADSSGRGQAVAIHEDGSLNSAANPASRGSVIVLYATGEGQTNPAGVDGKLTNSAVLAKPVLPVEVRVNGLLAEVLYAGAAPGLVAGTMQVNIRVPDGVPAASALPVVVNVGGISSRLDVTITVR